MTLEKLLLSVCEEMATRLDEEQLAYLKDTLFIKFHGKELRENSTALQTTIDAEEQRLMDFFRASKIISGRQASTIEQYTREISALRNACGKSLLDIGSVDIRWYFGMCRTKRGNSMSTVQSKRRYLNSFYAFLVREGFIQQNPVEKIEAMKVEKRLKHAFTARDLEKLRVACGTNYRNRALMEFLLGSGLRVSELCSLDVKDIDFSKLEFTVIGKGNKQRRCYLNETGCFYLIQYLDWRAEREKLSREELLNRPLFAGTTVPYARITKRGIEKALAALGEAAGVENVHPHRFRRTYASSLAARGCPLQDLRVLMGHSNVETTLVYCDVKDDAVSMSYQKYGKEA